MIIKSSLDRVRINGQYCYKVAYYDSEWTLNTFRLTILCDMANVSAAISHFKDIQTLEILEPSTDTLKKMTSRFTTYDSFNINAPGLYRDELNQAVETVSVTLKKADLEESVKRLENTVFPVINYSEMTINEYRDYIIEKFGEKCQENIFKGVDVTTEYGFEHFSATFADQNNIKALSDTALNFKVPLPYHADNSQCKMYSYLDILKIYCEIQKLVLYETTYCNALNSYLRTLQTKEEISTVEYGFMDFPKNIKETMNTALEQGQYVMQTIYAKVELCKS